MNIQLSSEETLAMRGRVGNNFSIAQEQKHLLVLRDALKDELRKVDARLIEINRPKHIDATQVLAEMREREGNKIHVSRLQKRKQERELREFEDSIPGELVGSF